MVKCTGALKSPLFICFNGSDTRYSDPNTTSFKPNTIFKYQPKLLIKFSPAKLKQQILCPEMSWSPNWLGLKSAAYEQTQKQNTWYTTKIKF